MNRLPASMILTFLMTVSAGTDATVTLMDLDPSPPVCAEEITFLVEGYFPDLCWKITGMDFIAQNNEYWFVIHSAGPVNVPEFFLVAATTGCAEGPKQGEEDP